MSINNNDGTNNQNNNQNNNPTPSDKSVENQQKINEDTAKTLEFREKMRKLFAEEEEYDKRKIDHLRDQAELLEKTARLLGDSISAGYERATQLEQEFKQIVKNSDHSKDVQKELLKGLEEIKKYGDTELISIDDKNDALYDVVENLKEEHSVKRGMALLDKGALKIADKLGESVGLRVKYKDSLFGSSVKLLTLLKDEGQAGEDAKKALSRYLKDMFSYQNIALNVFNAILKNSTEMFGNFDKAQASLAAATGQGDEFRGTLYEVGRQGNLFGVTMDEAGRAIGTLVDQTSNFTSLSKSLRDEVALSVAKMEKLGVTAADSAKIFQNFNQGLGITASESIKMQKELAMAGVSIGISASKITKDFNASLSTLMVYGKQSIDVFKGIAAAAKAAGVETSTLLQIAGKFDTFSGAAEGAGKLNALLGTQLSTTEMLMATEDERIRMLVESVQSQGVAFKDMDRFTQKAIANAAGISDMAEANRIFGMSLNAYDENQRQLNASADAQKKFDDAVSKTVPVMRQFKLLGAEIVVALEPVLETLEKGAKALTTALKEMDTETKETIAAVVGLAASFVLLVPIFKVGSGVFTALKVLGGALLPTIATTAPAAGGGIAGFAATITPALPILLKFGLIVMGVVASLALLAGAVALIGKAFSSTSIDSKIAKSEAKMSQLKAQAADAEARASEFEFKTAAAMSNIITGDHVGALKSVKAMVNEINKMGQDIKVSSTIENLALVTAGKATNITGQRVASNTTNITTKVQNFFDGLQLKLVIDDRTAFNAHIADVSNGDLT